MPNNSANATILVTGASGFLGSAVAAQLRVHGDAFRTTGRRAVPAGELPNYTPADLCDESAISQLVAGAGVVIHAAGLAHQHHVGRSQAADFFHVNTRGTEVVARAAAAAGCRRLILISSVSVYGSGSPPKTESDTCFPATPYARSKLEAERVAAEVAAAANMELIILRMATIYGENDPGNVGRLLRAIDRGRFVWIGNGQNRKSLVHVEDAARACVAAATLDQVPPYQVFNIAAKPYKMRAIVATLTSALGRRVPSFRLPASMPRAAMAVAGKVPGLGGRTRRFAATLEKWMSDDVFDATSFREAFGWRPAVRLQVGIARQVERYRSSWIGKTHIASYKSHGRKQVEQA